MTVTHTRCPEIQSWVEAQFPCVEGLAGPHSQTGEAYVVIGMGPIGFTIVRESEAEAIEAAKEAFSAYAVWKRGVLYWRILPEMAVHRDGRRKPEAQFKVYMRLLISDRPVLERAQDTPDPRLPRPLTSPMREPGR